MEMTKKIQLFPGGLKDEAKHRDKRGRPPEMKMEIEIHVER